MSAVKWSHAFWKDLGRYRCVLARTMNISDQISLEPVTCQDGPPTKDFRYRSCQLAFVDDYDCDENAGDGCWGVVSEEAA
jgi:hypothetical protein